jgi:RNA polymerase sigma factor (TIGR02999 family)
VIDSSNNGAAPASVGNGGQSTEELFPLIYDELRRLATRKLAQESPGHTLQTTGLVHEVFLRLANKPHGEPWQSRTHFLSAAAEVMRRILIDNARRRKSAKHGGGLRRQPIESAIVLAVDPSFDILELEEALLDLERREPQSAQLVKLRFFTGLSIDEAAEVLGISRATAKRRWTYARAWLYGQLSEKNDQAGG